MLERTAREKTAVEKELDKLYAEGVASKAGDQIQSTTPALEQLSGRIETAERERDEALTKRDSVLNQIARNNLTYVTSRHLCDIDRGWQGGGMRRVTSWRYSPKDYPSPSWIGSGVRVSASFQKKFPSRGSVRVRSTG